MQKSQPTKLSFQLNQVTLPNWLSLCCGIIWSSCQKCKFPYGLSSGDKCNTMNSVILSCQGELTARHSGEHSLLSFNSSQERHGILQNHRHLSSASRSPSQQMSNFQVMWRSINHVCWGPNRFPCWTRMVFSMSIWSLKLCELCLLGSKPETYWLRILGNVRPRFPVLWCEDNPKNKSEIMVI